MGFNRQTNHGRLRCDKIKATVRRKIRDAVPADGGDPGYRPWNNAGF
jgi:hypothetical protein